MKQLSTKQLLHPPLQLAACATKGWKSYLNIDKVSKLELLKAEGEIHIFCLLKMLCHRMISDICCQWEQS